MLSTCRKYFCLFFIFFISAFQLFSQPDGKTYIIANVRVEGTKFSDAETIVAISGLQIGDKINLQADAKLQTALRNLWKRKQFSNIEIKAEKITTAGVFLVIKVQENQRLSQIIFENNDKLSQTELNKTASKMRGDIISPYDVYLIKQKLKKLYEGEGLMFANIESKVVPTDTANYSKLILNIDEGAQFKVEAIEFSGNKLFTGSELASSFEDTKENVWWKFWSSGKFDKNKYEKDKELLRKYFKQKGFIYGEMVKDTVIYDNDKKNVTIRITVNEGPKFYIRKIAFKGNIVFPSDLLRKRLDFKEGVEYNVERFDMNMNGNEDQTDIRSLYMDNGYLTSFLEKEERAVGQDSIDVTIKVIEGTRITIRKVDIVGNSKTKDKVIRRELYTRPGDYFDKSAVIKSVRALGVLNYFNQETLKPDIKPVEQDNTKVDVVYKVEERSTDTFNASIGFAGTFGLTGAIGFTFNNFSLTEPFKGGSGQIFNFNWEFGQANRYQTISIGFTEPWLLDEPTTVGFNIFDTRQNYIYNIRRTGTAINLGRRFHWPDDYFRGDWSLRFSRNDVGTSGSAYWRPGISTEFTIAQAFSRISLNNIFFPTVGSRFAFSTSVALGALGLSTTDYFKNEITFDMYNPLFQIDGNDRLVLYLGTKAGYITGFKSDTAISPIELYMIGGNGLGGFGVTPLRGYQDPRVGAVDAGRVLSKYTAELRFAVTLAPMPIYIYGFMEAGNVWKSLKITDPFDLKRSAGFGVQLMINPIGVVGFSYGYGFDKDYTGAISGWRFLFHLGQQ
ncbi:MAG: yaeT [Ignavibacteria bacterium]|nr:yaeT [Ignavibacteria bacterium]